jgi:phosphopantothenoylcysteine decarboxylase/phosphopantothenate--cysteine ligase
MAAAVADWRPAAASPRKLKKDRMSPVLHLERTADILATIRSRKGRRLFVGFAAETDDVISEAKRKLADKGLDLIVANDVSRPDSGFEVDTNQVAFIGAGGEIAELPLLRKDVVAARLLDWMAARARAVTSV